ncbi:hypothetical protein MMC25_001496 [Agyrium rufum]|nr:hypothetical protein [Agyrium rufum]
MNRALVIKVLLDILGRKVATSDQITISTYYKSQAAEYRTLFKILSTLEEYEDLDLMKVIVITADSYIGQEREVVIVDFVTSTIGKHRLGFVLDKR